MLWLVVALPSVAVIGGIATLVLALRDGGADVVPAEVRRTAQVQVEDLTPDRRALRDGLAARMVIDAASGAVRLGIEAGAPPPVPSLELHLVHPLRSEADRRLSLVRSGPDWHGRLEAQRTHAWNLRLGPPDGSWRLVGRLEPGATQAALRPALRD